MALLIREGNDEDKPLWRDDFAKDPFAPHCGAVRRLHTVVKDATWSEIELAGKHLEAFRPPPMGQTLGLGPRLEDEVEWRIEDARDNECAFRVSITFVHGLFSPWFVTSDRNPISAPSFEITFCINNSPDITVESTNIHPTDS